MVFFGKAQTAKEENNKQTATEIINLKITNAQIKSYAETQEMPSLQYLADQLCEDNEMQYVELESKKIASLQKIYVKEAKSIFTKLKEYPYEFEIDGHLKLASINGVKVADNSSNMQELEKRIQELETSFQTAKTSYEANIASQQAIIDTLNSKVQKLEQDGKIDYSINNERLVGKWYDGSDMYELSVEIVAPTTTDGVMVENKVDLSKYNIKECIIVGGYYKKTDSNNNLPINWTTTGDRLMRIYYSCQDKTLRISTNNAGASGLQGYVTIRYKK